jgi:pimeloyl-ACP methyl ester carboxylesterase
MNDQSQAVSQSGGIDVDYEPPPWVTGCVRTDRMPPYGRLPDDNWKEIDWAAHEHLIDVNGVSTNYVDIGSGGPTVLLVHGIGASYHTWLCTIPSLARHRRVIALDLPGFGRSERPARQLDAPGAAEHIERFCDILDLGPVDLVGHSMGAFLTIQLAHEYPHRVRSLALVSGGLSTVLKFYSRPLHTLIRRPLVCSRFITLILLATLPVPHQVVRFIIDNRMMRSITCSLYVNNPDAIDGDSLYEAMSGGGRLGTLSTALMGFRYRFDDIASTLVTRFGKPVLVVAGENDSVAGKVDATEFCQSIGPSELILFPETGHWPMVERPATLNCALLAWLGHQPES